MKLTFRDGQEADLPAPGQQIGVARDALLGVAGNDVALARTEADLARYRDAQGDV